MIKRFWIWAFLLISWPWDAFAEAPTAAKTNPEATAADPGPYRPAPETRARSGGRRGARAAPRGASGGIKDTSAQHRPMALAALAYVPWIYGIGIGISTAFEIPIVHDGFIPSLNDSFSIEPSFGFAYLDHYGSADADYALLFRPAVGAKWSFYLMERLRVYGLVNFGYSRVNRYWDADSISYKADDDYYYGELAGGVEWSFAEHCALRAEIAPHGLRSGIIFLL